MYVIVLLIVCPHDFKDNSKKKRTCSMYYTSYTLTLYIVCRPTHL